MLFGHRNDPVGLPRQPAAVRPCAARAARAAAARRSADPDLGSRLRPDDGLDRPLARARAARGAPAGAGRGPAPRRLVPGCRGDGRRLARRARRGAARHADPLVSLATPVLIERTRDGEELPEGAVRELVEGFVAGDVAPEQMSAWCMAVVFRGLSDARDRRAVRRDARLGRAARPLGARPPGRRQALDGRGGGQDDDRARAARRGLRRARREDVGPRARAHGRHARQARGDPRLPRGARARRDGRPGAADRLCGRRPERAASRRPTG